jgi:NADP-dependent 3-hydroxy acid dehydrogenase YdfG
VGLQQVQETLGPIDILAHNAGVAPVSRAERHTLDRWQQALDINLTAVFLCCQKVGQQMIETWKHTSTRPHTSDKTRAICH